MNWLLLDEVDSQSMRRSALIVTIQVISPCMCCVCGLCLAPRRETSSNDLGTCGKLISPSIHWIYIHPFLTQSSIGFKCAHLTERRVLLSKSFVTPTKGFNLERKVALQLNQSPPWAFPMISTANLCIQSKALYGYFEFWTLCFCGLSFAFQSVKCAVNFLIEQTFTGWV